MFPVRVSAVCADSCRSNLAAERAFPRHVGADTWWHGFFRCFKHRSRTAELSTMHMDSVTEKFCLNLTLSFVQSGTAKAFRARARGWLKSKLVVRQGTPPAHALESRRRLLEHLDTGCGGGSHTELPRNSWATAKQRVALLTLFNGDLHCTDEVQDYCSPVCCPPGATETLEKMLGELGLQALLQPLPSVFPRKPWQGQASVVAHLLLLEAAHGLLSTCAPRKAQKGSRGSAAPAASGDAALREQEDLWRGIRDFWMEGDCLQRLWRFLSWLQPWRRLKAEVAKRNGHAWELAQRALACDGHARSSQTSAACFATEAETVAEACTSAARSLSRPGDSENLLTVLGFIRAGAALKSTVLDEQRRYPWKLFSLLEDSASAAEVLHDWQSCPSVVGDLGRKFCAMFPTEAALTSTDAQALLWTIAVVVEETTTAVERFHSGTRRQQNIQQQTWPQRLALTSAWRQIAQARQWVCEGDGGTSGGAVPGLSARRKAPALPGGRRRGGGGCARAWMKDNAKGFISGADWARLRVAMSDDAARAHYQELGRLMTLAGRCSTRRRRPHRPADKLKHHVRKSKAAFTRQGLPWNSGEAKARVQQSHVSLQARVWRSAKAKLHEARREEEQAKTHVQKQVQEGADNAPPPPLPNQSCHFAGHIVVDKARLHSSVAEEALPVPPPNQQPLVTAALPSELAVPEARDLLPVYDGLPRASAWQACAAILRRRREQGHEAWNSRHLELDEEMAQDCPNVQEADAERRARNCL
ncbi:MAG: hypothetical protein GY772_32995, partial [bacterium]|nr:hypothetical protein [bacterium]